MTVKRDHGHENIIKISFQQVKRGNEINSLTFFHSRDIIVFELLSKPVYKLFKIRMLMNCVHYCNSWLFYFGERLSYQMLQDKKVFVFFTTDLWDDTYLWYAVPETIPFLLGTLLVITLNLKQLFLNTTIRNWQRVRLTFN